MQNNQNPFFTILGFDPTAQGGDGVGQNPPVNFEYNGPDLKERLADMSKKAMVVSVIVAVIVLAGMYWWFHPAINIHSIDMWFFVAAFILLPSFVFFKAKSAAYKNGTKKVGVNDGKAKAFKFASYVPVLIVILVLVGALLSLSLFPGNAKKYASILETTDMAFVEDIQEVDYNEIPVIDRSSAVLLGNRTMGTMSDLVSQFEISSLYSQINYQDHPVRVSPLVYADLFKWLQNREEGIPAYVVVDMTTQDAQVVRTEQGIKYSQSEPLARNIDRYVQLKYPFYMFGEKSFEIDDDGQAWWVCPVRDFTIGLFGGETISRAVLVNASTGECQDVAVEDVPSWVDRVYPADLLIEQYNWSGKYSDGWLNSWLGQNGVVQTTPGTDGILGYNYIAKDDDVWVYTGVTSAVSDNSIVGFVLVNQRTAESHFYAVAGATEESAMSSAEGQVQNLRYEATFPILINVDDVPTYFMALKDGAGLVKKYAMVDIEHYQNVAVGDTVADTQKAYEALLISSGAQEVPQEETLTGSGVIKTINQAVINGNSRFYVTLEGDDLIYDFPLPDLVEIVACGVGDTVEFTYVEGSPICTVTSLISRAGVEATEGAGDLVAAENPAAQDSAQTSGDAAAQSGDAAAGEAAPTA